MKEVEREVIEGKGKGKGKEKGKRRRKRTRSSSRARKNAETRTRQELKKLWRLRTTDERYREVENCHCHALQQEKERESKILSMSALDKITDRSITLKKTDKKRECEIGYARQHQNKKSKRRLWQCGSGLEQCLSIRLVKSYNIVNVLILSRVNRLPYTLMEPYFPKVS